MRIAICQLDTTWMDQERNLRKISAMAEEVSGRAEMIFLPEMFNTGYVMTPGQIPIQWQDSCIDRLQQIANAGECWIAGSIPYFQEGRWVNRLLVISAQGVQAHYDKSHLFTPAGESAVYAPGATSNVFHKGLWCFRPLICYDLRFPYLSFQTPMADVLFYSANWPSARISHWHALLKARAIENQCYVIGVNRTGTDHNGYTYPGQSTIISYTGDVVCTLSEEESVATAILEKSALEEYRKKLPFSADRKII